MDRLNQIKAMAVEISGTAEKPSQTKLEKSSESAKAYIVECITK